MEIMEILEMFLQSMSRSSSILFYYLEVVDKIVTEGYKWKRSKYIVCLTTKNCEECQTKYNEIKFPPSVFTYKCNKLILISSLNLLNHLYITHLRIIL
jgi:hypothetical protein